MNLLVTGIQGFIGSYLSEHFSRYYNLYGLDISASSIDGVEKTYNWSEMGLIPPLDSIIHLAGKAHDTKNISDPQSYFDINVGLTKTIFDYFLESKAQKFIFFSSVKAVADTVEGDYLTEDEPPNPKTPYGQSKLEAERYILSNNLPAGKKVYILRPCMIYGPGNKGNLNLLYNIVKKGIPYPLGAFHNLRSFTSIENLLFIIRKIIDKDINPGIYHVADDEPISTIEIVELISDSLSRNPRIWNVPKGVIKGIAKTGDLMHLPLNSERLKKLTESYVVSNAKLKSALGIKNMPIPAKEGFKHTFDSFSQ